MTMGVSSRVKRLLSLVLVVCFMVTSIQPPSAYAVIQETIGSEEKDREKEEAYIRALVAKAKEIKEKDPRATQVHVSRRLLRVDEADMVLAKSLGKDGREVLANLLNKLSDPKWNREEGASQFTNLKDLSLGKAGGRGQTFLFLQP